MITFKKIDWIVQSLLIITGLVMGYQSSFANYNFAYGYFFVGTWQVLSVFIHLAFPASVKIAGRKIYMFLLLLTAIAGLITFVLDNDSLVSYMLVMLFWSPCLAIFYLVISIIESQRPVPKPVVTE